MSTKLTPKQAKFVKAKLQGKSNTQAAIVATGSTNHQTAEKQGHRLSRNVQVQEYLTQSVADVLNEAHIDLRTLLQPFIEALTKTTEIKEKYKKPRTEFTYDIKTRMYASDKLMAFETSVKSSNKPEPMPNKDLIEALNNNVDDVELYKLAFKKSDPRTDNHLSQQ